MCSINQIQGFLNHLYLSSNWVDQHDFLYTNMDQVNVKNASNIFSWLVLKMLLANQIAKFLNQLYFRNKLMNQLDF